MNPKIRNVAGLAMMALSAMAWSAEGDKAAPVAPGAPEVAAAPAPVAGKPWCRSRSCSTPAVRWAA